MKGDLWATARFIDNLRIPYIAPSLGGVESLIEMPAVQSYWSFGPEGRAKIGIKENLVGALCRKVWAPAAEHRANSARWPSEEGRARHMMPAPLLLFLTY